MRYAAFVLVRQRDDLATHALAVSDPSNKDYARFTSVADIAEKYGASKDTKDALTAYLTEELGATAAAELEFDVTGTFALMPLTETQATTLFGTVPIQIPTVPEELANAVTGIFGLLDWSASAKATEKERLTTARAGVKGSDTTATVTWPDYVHGSGDPPKCPSVYGADVCTPWNWSPPAPLTDYFSFFPSQFRTAYGVDDSLKGAGHSAVVLESDQTVDASVIDEYAKALGYTFRATDLKQITYGTSPSSGFGSEARLDVETLVGMAPDLDHITLLNSGDMSFLTFLPYGLAKGLDKAVTGGARTDLISISLGMCEAYYGDTLHVLLTATEPVLQTAAATGVTVVAGAGDQGSSGCATTTKPYKPGPQSPAVAYPGSSAWVTAVGGTTLTLDNTDNSFVSARVWNDWPLKSTQCTDCRLSPTYAGGGGTSDHIKRPPWQDAVNTGTYRTVPDVAHYASTIPGSIVLAYQKDGAPFWRGDGNGTSLATPIFGALMILLSEHEGQRVGFANPLLYKTFGTATDIYRDITDGDNRIGGETALFATECCSAGTGYDLASGWGSLRLDKAIEELAK